MKKQKQVIIRVHENAFLKCKEELNKMKKARINTLPMWSILENCACIKLEKTAQDTPQLYRKKTDDLIYTAVNISADLMQAVRLRMLKTDGDVASFFSESFEENFADVIMRPKFEAPK